MGRVRIAYNSALFFLSPLAGGLAETTSIRRMLNWTTLVRAIIYGLLFPGLWLLFFSGEVSIPNVNLA